MSYILMTKSSTPIIGQLAVVLGWIMDANYKLISMVGIHSNGISIILFTIITAILMLPMTVSQQKFMKISNLMQPEMKAIQNKYKGKTDQTSAAKQNGEIQALYDKYGVSPTGSCLPLLIQFPILLALYQVILNVPAYVNSVREVFMNIVTPLQSQANYIELISEIAESHSLAVTSYDYTDASRVINLLYKLSSSEWESLKEIFPSIADVITENVAQINTMNSFLTINLAESPWDNLFRVAIIIPIIAGLMQFLSVKTMSSSQKKDDGNEMQQQMQTMNTMMPLISVVFCFSLPAAVGIYWAASSGSRLIIQMGVNRYMDSLDVNDMIKENIEKKNKKRAKKGLPPINEQAMMQKIEKAQRLSEKEQKASSYSQEMRDAAQAKSTEYYNSKSSNPGSISSKAKLVKDYHEKRGSRKKSV